jgi:hypothetical protein
MQESKGVKAFKIRDQDKLEQMDNETKAKERFL